MDKPKITKVGELFLYTEEEVLAIVFKACKFTKTIHTDTPADTLKDWFNKIKKK